MEFLAEHRQVLAKVNKLPASDIMALYKFGIQSNK